MGDRAIVGAAWVAKTAGLMALACAAACQPAVVPVEAPPVLAIEPAAPVTISETESSSDTAPKVCVIETEDYEATDQSWSLVLPKSEAPWAYLNRAKKGRASVTLAGPRKTTVSYDFVGSGMALSGLALAEGAEIYAAKPMWFADVALVRADHAMTWTRAGRDGVGLEVELGLGFSPRHVERLAPCDELGLTSERYDEDALVAMKDAEPRQILGNEELELFATAATKRPSLRMSDQDGLMVEAGPRDGDRRQVVLSLGRAVIRAWVLDQRLGAMLAMTGVGGGGYGYGTGRGSLGAKRRVLTCARRLALEVKIDKRQGSIGSLAPGRVFWVTDSEPLEDGWRIVHVDDAPISLAGGARLVAEDAALARCTEAP
jgi:hypothetical protein